MRLAEVGLAIKDVDLGAVDAEADSNLDAYFITTPYVDAAFAGRKAIFLGRKGSGKSALFRQLDRLASERSPNSMVIPVTPDHYAWAALRSYKEQGLLAEQAHANAWKLTLAMEIAAALAGLDRSWDKDASQQLDVLRKFLGDNFGTINPSLAQTASKVIRGLKQFNISAFGFGAGMQRELSESALTPAVVDELLKLLRAPTREQNVLIALDRLDDSWDGSEESRNLLIGLLKAAKEINDSFREPERDPLIRVLVFLRSDIYDVLRFDDKDKHRSTEESIIWTPDLLKEMLGRRLPSGVGVDDLFEAGYMRGSISPFTYLVKRTFLRPREVLQFTQECLSQADPSAQEISKDLLRSAEERYSRWKVSDLQQEFVKSFPGFPALIDCLRQEYHRYDSLSDLEEILGEKIPVIVNEHKPRRLLERLFDCSVIGVRLSDAGSTRFKCEDNDLTLPQAGAVYVHQSLYKGLNIRERRASGGPGGDEQPDINQTSIQLYQIMMASLPIQDLTFLGMSPTPVVVFQAETFQDCAYALGAEIEILPSDVSVQLKRPAGIAQIRYDGHQGRYAKLRADLMTALNQSGITVEQYLAAENAASNR